MALEIFQILDKQLVVSAVPLLGHLRHTVDFIIKDLRRALFAQVTSLADFLAERGALLGWFCPLPLSGLNKNSRLEVSQSAPGWSLDSIAR